MRDLAPARSYVLRIPRCLKPYDGSEFVPIELHHFSDISELRCRTVSYLSFFSEECRAYCSFLYSKSWV